MHDHISTSVDDKLLEQSGCFVKYETCETWVTGLPRKVETELFRLWFTQRQDQITPCGVLRLCQKRFLRVF